jgi:murein DD-endopeptidase MepM/ murein hydrolase activator NlpD
VILRTSMLLGGALVLSACGGHDDFDTHDYDCSVFPNAASSPYILPREVGKTFNANPHAAWDVGSQMYAYDLGMPIGTRLLAIRDGTVVRVVGSFSNDDHLLGHENYVLVEHADGTFARYVHLTTDGALVSAGDAVVQGEVIALSGNSGNTRGPHTHLDVLAHCCSASTRDNQLSPDPTIPINFRNAGRESSGEPADLSCGLPCASEAWKFYDPAVVLQKPVCRSHGCKLSVS